MNSLTMQSPSDQNSAETTATSANSNSKPRIIRRWNTTRNCWETGFYKQTNFVILNVSADC